MKHTAEKKLISNTPLSLTDAVRLVLEGIEELGESVKTCNREELLRRMRQVIREGVAAIQAAEQTVSFEEAAWHSVAARRDRRPVTLRDLKHYVRRMLRVEGAATRPLRRMTASDCRRILQTAFENSPSSYKKGRAILHSIFEHGIRHEWVDHNPVKKVCTPIIHEKQIKPLTLIEVKKLEKTVRQPRFKDMQLALHLMMYCGIRPSEVQRLQVSDIDWKQRNVIIRPHTSKTGGGRLVPLRRADKVLNMPLPRGNWAEKWRALRKSAGFTNWQADALRHTFASYHALHFKNLPQLQLEMGHRDCQLLRTRYTLPITENVKLFWA